MLRPDYFNDKADELIELYSGLETFILKDIAMRILKSGEIAGTTDRELWKLEQMGLSRQAIMKELSRLTGMTEQSLRYLLQDAILTSWADEKMVYDALGMSVYSPLENAMVMSVIDAEWKKVKGELNNLTLTTMNQAQSDLISLLNEVDFRVASGMQSYSSAVCEVLDRYGRSGTMVSYPTGSRRSLEAAVRCAVVTSMNQTAAQVSNQYIAQNRIEYVWVSEHFGARYDKNNPTGVSSHDWWQGKAYKIVGSEEGFPNLLESTGYTIDMATGQGRVVNPLGLHGYNCRHTHGAWAKELGAFDQKIDREKSQKMYDLQQRQRAMERSIRQTKKELLVKQMECEQYPDNVDLQMEYQNLSSRYERQNAEYNRFCKDNNLQTQPERLKVAEFKRKEAAKAKAKSRNASLPPTRDLLVSVKDGSNISQKDFDEQQRIVLSDWEKLPTRVKDEIKDVQIEYGYSWSSCNIPEKKIMIGHGVEKGDLHHVCFYQMTIFMM